MQPVHQLLDKALAELIATGAALDPAAVFVGVGIAIAPAGVATTIAAITMPQGQLGTRQPITTWSTPYRLANGSPVADSPAKRFTPASAAEGATLACWYLADAATGGNLLAYGLIHPDAPVPDQNSAFSIIVRVILDPQGAWSAEVTFNG